MIGQASACKPPAPLEPASNSTKICAPNQRKSTYGCLSPVVPVVVIGDNDESAAIAPNLIHLSGPTILSPIGNHSFRATGMTAYLANGGTLEHAQSMAAHESPRTTKLYDRTKERLTQDEIERIVM
jgi:hypothetical protein